MNTPVENSGFVLDDLDESTRPQDDLYRHVNNRWFERTDIPSDKARYGTFDVLADGAELAIREILDESRSAAQGTEARKVGDIYTSFLDETRVEELGGEPLGERLKNVERIGTMKEFTQLVGSLQRLGLGGFYLVFVDNDPGDPSRYVVLFEQGGLSLPDESYYREEHFANVREALVRHIARMFQLAGLDDGDARAQRIFDLEVQLASHHWNNVESRDSEKTYNLTTWQNAAQLFGDGLLESWRRGVEAPERSFDEVVLRQPSFGTGLGELLVAENLESWKDWLKWQVIASDAPFLSSAFVNEHFDFYGKTLTGAEELRPRWKRAVALAEGAMGEAVGKMYVERHYPPEVKDRMDVLVGNLIEAYRASITDLEWMSTETRQRALEKLDAFTPKIGYPVKWRDYST
ncbi:MAG TPA: M13 family metallopeptidase N-terminal domain-containing protein, partial [Acidimicrobiales bacterium]